MEQANTVLAVLAILISLATHLNTRPGVKVRGGRAGIFGGPEPLGTSLTVTVRSGRNASVTVEFWGFELRNRWGFRTAKAIKGISPHSVPKRSGPEYPHRIDPGDPSAVWGMAISDLQAFVGPNDRLRAYVQISTRTRRVRDRPWRLLRVEDFPLYEKVT